jgi:hypothetical protein
MTIAQKIIPQTWIADSAEPSPSGTFFAVFLDLPAPPQKFVDLFRSIGIPNSDSEDQGAYNERTHGTRYYTHRALTNWKGQSFVAPRVQRGSLNADWEDWVRDNITDQYKDTGIGWTLGSPECPSIGAHADRTRQATLLYNIDPGGPNTELVFYQENGYPLIRTRGDHTLSDENLKPVGYKILIADRTEVDKTILCQGERCGTATCVCFGSWFMMGWVCLGSGLISDGFMCECVYVCVFGRVS